MSDRPIALRIMDDMAATIAGCPSITDCIYDRPFNFAGASLPLAFLWDAVNEVSESGSPILTIELSALVTVAYPYTERPGQSCRERGHLLMAELVAELAKDPKRGLNDESNCPLAMWTRPVEWKSNPVPESSGTATLDAVFSVQFMCQANDLTRQ